MILKCSTGFWTSKAWSSVANILVGNVAANIVSSKTNGFVKATNSNTIAILTGYGRSRTTFNNGSVARDSVLCADNGQTSGITLGLPTTMQGFELMFGWSASAAYSGYERLLTVRVNDSLGAPKYLCLRFDATGFHLNEGTTLYNTTNEQPVADGSLNRTNWVNFVITEIRLRVYKDGNNIKFRASAFHLSSIYYDVVHFTYLSDGTGFLDIPANTINANVAAPVECFQMYGSGGNGNPCVSDLTCYELEAADVSGGYSATDTFQPMPRCLPLARKTTDVIEYAPAGNQWTDLNGANAGTSWDAITDGNDTTGNIMEGTNKVGLKTVRSLQDIATANGYSCSVILEVSNMVVRLADDDGEAITSEIGKVTGGTPQTQVFSGTPGTDIIYCQRLQAAGLTAAGIDKNTTDVQVNWKQNG
jgi:hypothetical protein